MTTQHNQLASSKSFDVDLCHCYRNRGNATSFQRQHRRQPEIPRLQDLPEEDEGSNQQPRQKQPKSRRLLGFIDAVRPGGIGIFGRLLRSKSATCGSDVESKLAALPLTPVLETEASAPNLANIGGRGESIPASSTGASADALTPNLVARRRRSPPSVSKRRSLPSSPTAREGNSPEKASFLASLMTLSKRDRRNSLADIGFGKSSSYRKLEKLGQGTYATVYLGKSNLTDSPVALKEIRLEHDEGAPCTAIREVSLLRDLKHANIVTLHDVVHTDKTLTLVFEYLDQDLKQCLEECHGRLHPGNVRLFLYQLLRGLEFCHRRRCLHRDLKPQNILLSRRGELKLADFGLARANSVPSKNYSNEVCTLWYRPADVLIGSVEYGTPIDLWGVGAIFFEMLTGRPMFPGATVEEQLQLIFQTLGSPTDANWPGSARNPYLSLWRCAGWPRRNLRRLAPELCESGSDLMGQLMRYPAGDRIPADRARRHIYFTRHLPAEVLDIPDSASIFDVPGIMLFPNADLSLEDASRRLSPVSQSS